MRSTGNAVEARTRSRSSQDRAADISMSRVPPGGPPGRSRMFSAANPSGRSSKPLRTSRSRRPNTGESAVTTSAVHPASSARRTRHRVTSGSGCRYSWNQTAAAGSTDLAAATTAPTATVEAMLDTSTVPAAAVALAVASSPSGCARRWNAVGATTTGIDARAPGRATARSRTGVPRRIRGSSASRPNARSFSPSTTSSAAPPAK